MLGKVFENLLPENIRHASGTYYTPRVIVHYMCQQALLHYLVARAPHVPQNDLALFLRHAERFADFEAKDKKSYAERGLLLPVSISQNAASLDDLLATITVCDPAIGSGAFPVGMMHEIVRARIALTPALEKTGDISAQKPRSAYALKRDAIHHSLYGVDLDPGAVEIAKLRLWLSMVVDEEEIGHIQPLPNLDYKIMQGNSLLEEFDGIRLLDEKLLQPPDAARDSEIADLKARIAAKSQQLFALEAGQGINAKRKTERQAVNQEVNRLKKQLASLVNPAEAKSGAQGELNQQTSWASLKRIQELHSKFFDEDSRAEKDRLRKELDALEWNFMEATLREQGREEAIAELKRASAKHRKPFFLWRLHFGEVFQQRGGFDVVMANPPFVRMELFKDDKPALERRFPHLFVGRADIYVYFYGVALDILRDKGCLTFISSNTYLNAKFGEKLRKHFQETTTVFTLIDFAETKVFDAVVEPAIVVMQKALSDGTTVRCVKWQEDQPLDDLPDIVSHKSQAVLQQSFSSEPWRLVAGVESRLLEKLNRGTQLNKIATDGILYGVKTGLNAAFVIDDAKRRELCEDERSSEIIKPFIRGRDISRWAVCPTKAWLIYTFHGIDIRQYRLIEKHLRQFKDALEKRATQQEWFELQQPQFKYSKLFSKPKIVYQDISRTYAFAYDTAGCFCGDTTFVLPTNSLAIVGILQSNAIKWWAHTDQGVPFGGFLRLKAQYMERCPIPNMNEQQEHLISRLVEYLLWLHREVLPQAELAGNAGATLLAGYFEQWVNALVYELFFPEPLHAAGLHFFRLAEQAKLPALSEIEGRELAALRAKFEELYAPNHPLRQGLFALDSIEEIRIIEGKA